MTTTQPFDDHLLSLWADQNLVTPAFIYDESRILHNLQALSIIGKYSGCRIIYSIKALSYAGVLKTILPNVSGFSASSLFESRLARDIGGNDISLHLTSPGIRLQDMPEIGRLCDYVSFNSLTQWQRLREWSGNSKCGLRINPGISFARDIRFDPCREGSKLGVPVSELPPEDNSVWNGDITGLHIHTNCESREYNQLMQTIEHLESKIPGILKQVEWLNLGGGYMLTSPEKLNELSKFLGTLSSNYNLQLFFEPGKAIVGNAGYVVASVIDLFESDGKNIAILDTTINHLPEVFEYQYRPAILQENQEGQYTYRLSGASCLSGDIFGDYRFEKPLETGNRIIFRNAGAYMMVKANMFNGINLPTVYSINDSGRLLLQKEYGYSDYFQRLITG